MSTQSKKLRKKYFVTLGVNLGHVNYHWHRIYAMAFSQKQAVQMARKHFKPCGHIDLIQCDEVDA